MEESTHRFTNQYKYYRVEYLLENWYIDLEDAMRTLSAGVCPRAPLRYLPGEDAREPRVCVSDTLVGAFRAIGSTSLERICDFEYFDTEKMHQTFPILILEYVTNKPLYSPDITQVSDVSINGEYWIRDKVPPTLIYSRWLAFDSLSLNEMGQISAFKLYDFPMPGYRHPWITQGQGVILDTTEYIDGRGRYMLEVDMWDLYRIAQMRDIFMEQPLGAIIRQAWELYGETLI